MIHGTHVDRCMMYTGIRLQQPILTFISSFFFLSNFQTLKIFVTLFSGTVRPRRLKLGTHVDSGQMYLVYRNQAPAAAYSSLYFFIFLSLNFQTLIFTHFFPKYTLSFLYFFIFLSLQFSNINFHTFLSEVHFFSVWVVGLGDGAG